MILIRAIIAATRSVFHLNKRIKKANAEQGAGLGEHALGSGRPRSGRVPDRRKLLQVQEPTTEEEAKLAPDPKPHISNANPESGTRFVAAGWMRKQGVPLPSGCTFTTRRAGPFRGSTAGGAAVVATGERGGKRHGEAICVTLDRRNRYATGSHCCADPR